jgi:hypothetical protein
MILAEGAACQQKMEYYLELHLNLGAKKMKVSNGLFLNLLGDNYGKNMDKIIFLLFVLITTSCYSENDSYKYTPTGELKEKSSYIVHYDSAGFHAPFHTTRYYYDEPTKSEFLSVLLPEQKQINYYDLKKGKLAYTINIKAGIDSYYTNNFDSIFVIANENQKIYLYNINGNLIKEYNYSRFLKKSTGKYLSQSIFYGHPQFSNNKLYLRVVNDENYYTESGVLILKFDGDDIADAKLTAPFPPGYEEQLQYYFNCDPVFAVQNDKVFMAFSEENEIFLFDEKHLIEKKSAVCDNLPEFTRYSKSAFKSDGVFQSQCGRFKNFAYDMYQKLFYRVASLEVPPKERKKPAKLMQRRSALCVFDENMNKLNEFLFDNKNYGAQSLLVTKNGFIMPKASDENREANIIEWTLFEYVR